MQFIKLVLMQLKVTVQIRGLSRWQQSQALSLPTASAGTPVYRPGQSEAFQVPMLGSWQVRSLAKKI